MYGGRRAIVMFAGNSDSTTRCPPAPSHTTTTCLSPCPSRSRKLAHKCRHALFVQTRQDQPKHSSALVDAPPRTTTTTHTLVQLSLSVARAFLPTTAARWAAIRFAPAYTRPHFHRLLLVCDADLLDLLLLVRRRRLVMLRTWTLQGKAQRAHCSPRRYAREPAAWFWLESTPRLCWLSTTRRPVRLCARRRPTPTTTRRSRSGRRRTAVCRRRPPPYFDCSWRRVC